MMAAKSSNPVFCAIDTPDSASALALARQLEGAVGGIKLGLEYFSANGPAGVAAMGAPGLPLFLDLKFHDIPNTVARAVTALAPLGPAIMTVHAGGGRAMMQAAVDAAGDTAAKHGVPRPLIVGVTVLTSLDGSDLKDMGVNAAPVDQVLRLAGLARDAGLDGIVCSPLEIAAMRARFGADFTLVVPGIRPAGAAKGDQKRVMTPAEALNAGASHLVIGRPITQSDDPRAAAEAIGAELGL